MKPLSDLYRMGAAILLSACLLWSCRTDGTGPVGVNLRIGANNVIDVRSFSNDDTLSVDRILVMPFTKGNTLAEDFANYTAAPELAVQIDVDQFPVNNLQMFLSPMSTCRLVVLGFNRRNYDFYNRNPLTDDIILYYDGSLADLSVEDRAAAHNTSQTAELFFDMSAPFVPNGNTSVSALLKRIVGGISVTLTNVPEGVEMRLYHTSAITTRWMVTEETAAGSITPMGYYPMTDNGGVSSYARYYFPTDGTPITMDLEAVDESEEPHRVVVGTSEGSEFNLNADQAINLSGDYRSVILGQELFTVDNTNNNIGIDDDNWDGVDDTPETDPE